MDQVDLISLSCRKVRWSCGLCDQGFSCGEVVLDYQLRHQVIPDVLVRGATFLVQEKIVFECVWKRAQDVHSFSEKTFLYFSIS